jgi:APA family basic amino acid/polyamine antiporter
MLLTVVLVRGIRESAETNNIMVVLKIAAILAFVFVGMRFIHPANYHPFVPEGWSGVLTGGSIIFFTYIGFDSVSTAAEEARNPQKDIPFGIIATLIVCTVLYIAVAVVLTGLVPWHSLVDDAAPVVNTMSMLAGTTKSALLHWTELAVLFGAMMGMISSLLVFQLGQARVWFSMSRDGLLPKVFGRVHPRFRTPATATWIAGVLVGIPAGILDIGTLSDLSNIGTLFAFVLVSLGVIILRYKQPERHRGFRAPGGLAAPILSVIFCILLMAGLPILTWLRFFLWLIIGLTVYWFYSRHRSEFSPRNANPALQAPHKP